MEVEVEEEGDDDASVFQEKKSRGSLKSNGFSMKVLNTSTARYCRSGYSLCGDFVLTEAPE